MSRIPSHPELRAADLSAAPAGAAFKDLLPAQASLLLTYSGRGAIYRYLAHLRAHPGRDAARRTVLIPAFHCPTVVDPALHAGFAVRFYRICPDLSIDAADFAAKVAARDVAAALFIRYFGVRSVDATSIALCRAHGVKSLDDCAHSFLETSPLRLTASDADAQIFSFWKLVPSAVGGGLLVRDPTEMPVQRGVRVATDDSLRRLAAYLRQVTDAPDTEAPLVVSPEEPVPAKRRTAEEAYPYVPSQALWRMPRAARLILERCNLRVVAETRRRNYLTLARSVRSRDDTWPLYADLPESACPWALPVYMRGRMQRDYLLRARGVPLFTFGEVLHPLLFEQHASERDMIVDARSLADSVLALSVHQGISASQVQAVAHAVEEFLR